MKTTKQILTEARALIADMDHWTQGCLARIYPSSETEGATSCDPNDPSARCWCADGALYKVIGHDPGPDHPGAYEHDAAADILSDASGRLFDNGDFVEVNDWGGPDAHANILKVFDTAIAGCA